MSNKIKKKKGFAFSVKKELGPLMNEETKNKVIAKSCQSLKILSWQNFSVVCQRVLSLQQARLMLASRRLTKNISDNYNAPSSDTFSSKNKICKTHCMLGNSLLCKLFLTSPTKDLLSSLKIKIITRQQVIGGNTLNLSWKRTLGYFPKIPAYKKISASPD